MNDRHILMELLYPFCPFKNDRRLTWLASGFAMLDGFSDQSLRARRTSRDLRRGSGA
jgi:hypothetical protein